jgi:hypothetical protein
VTDRSAEAAKAEGDANSQPGNPGRRVGRTCSPAIRTGDHDLPPFHVVLLLVTGEHDAADAWQ